MSTQYYEGVGRRKSATARVRIYAGTGTLVVNDKPLSDYFPRNGDEAAALLPLSVAGLQGKFDVSVKVNGGGVTGQTDAVQLGLARALLVYNPELKAALRKAGLK